MYFFMDTNLDFAVHSAAVPDPGAPVTVGMFADTLIYTCIAQFN
jgi:hypothetical protein